MISKNPDDRFTLKQILGHPLMSEMNRLGQALSGIEELMMAAKKSAIDRKKLRLSKNEGLDSSSEQGDDGNILLGEKKHYKPVIIRNRFSKLISPNALRFGSQPMNDKAQVETQNTERKDILIEKHQHNNSVNKPAVYSQVNEYSSPQQPDAALTEDTEEFGTNHFSTMISRVGLRQSTKPKFFHQITNVKF